MSTMTVRLLISADEVEKLLDLLGHDEATAREWDMIQLVRALYRHRAAFADPHSSTALELELTQAQIDLVHRYVTPAAFGQGGREFRLKLARAFVELERLEYAPDIEQLEASAAEPEIVARRLQAWKENRGGDEDTGRR